MIVVFLVLIIWYKFRSEGEVNELIVCNIVLFMKGECIIIFLNVWGYVMVVSSEIVVVSELLIRICDFFIWYVGYVLFKNGISLCVKKWM